MADLIIAIAMLCQVAPSGGSLGPSTLRSVDQHQVTCQKYYINCLEAQGQWNKPKAKQRKRVTSKLLADCIHLRRVK